MGPDRERQLIDLLLEAFEQPEAGRRTFLEDACGGDATLLAEALAHLAVEDQLDGFLEQPAGVAVAEPLDGPTRTLTGLSGGSLIETQLGHFGPGSKSRSRGHSVAGQSTDQHLRPRRRLGAYQIVGVVGEGGMGQVYAGEDTRLDRRVAVKVLPKAKAERSGWLERFEREARVLASLNHPNIVTIHSVEEDDGIRFLTMELVDGKTLGESIPEGGLPPEDFLRIATDLSRALAAAHERGVIHRDLKPANVMITPDGRVKILDFGLAKEPSRRDHALSQEGMMLGTVPYMAPEQLEGRPADARSDLFALGILFYRMATGEHPFPAGDMPQVVRAILENEPRSSRAIEQKLGVEVSEIIARCLEKQPDRRFQNAGEIRDRLARLQETRLAEKVLESRTDLRWPPSEGRWTVWRAATRRHPLVLSAVAIGIVLTLIAAFFRTRSPAPGVPGAAADAGRPEGARGLQRTALAVLFFHNLTGDPELEWLSTGIPELLITDLSQSPGLKVLDTGELHQIRKQLAGRGLTALSSEEIREVAREAQVEAVLRGSYIRQGGILRIVYNLEDPASGEILRSASFDGQGEESLFRLVGQLSAAVLDSLEADRPELGPATVEEATTASIAAWQAYSRGLTLYHSESRPEQAIESLEEALRIDPDFALASVNLAKMHQSLGHTAEAQRHAKSAFDLAERLPLNTRFDAEAGHFGTRWATTGRAIETYGLALKVYPGRSSWRNNLARRYAFFERYADAIEEFQRLIDARDYWGDYYGAANSRAALGDFETGYRLLADFAEEYPGNWLLHYSLAWHLTEWGRFEEAAGVFDRVAALRPDTPQLHYGRWRLAVLSEAWDQAEREARRLLALEDSFGRWRGNVALAQGALYRGESAPALAWLEAAIEAASGADRALVRCFQAQLLLARGDAGAALEVARKAQEEGREQWPELRGFYLAALAEQALGRPAAADALLETLRERWRRQPNAVEERQLYHLTGLLARARGDLDAASTALERAAALLPANGIEFSWHVFPAHVPIWTDLGAAELAAGRPRAALGWLSRATASGSEHLEQPVAYVRSLYLEALAYRALGEEAKARPRFERFLGYWSGGDLHPDWLAAARSE